MYDPRIIMDLVHRYGRACGEDDFAQAGLLFSEITRVVTDVGMSFDDYGMTEAPRPISEETGRGAIARAA